MPFNARMKQLILEVSAGAIKASKASFYALFPFNCAELHKQPVRWLFCGRFYPAWLLSCAFSTRPRRHAPSQRPDPPQQTHGQTRRPATRRHAAPQTASPNRSAASRDLACSSAVREARWHPLRQRQLTNVFDIYVRVYATTHAGAACSSAVGSHNRSRRLPDQPVNRRKPASSPRDCWSGSGVQERRC